MSGYMRVALTGVVTFPLLAFLMLVPYMIYEYRRYGSIPAWKSFVVFSMLLYGICAYYMVILPLPESRTAFVAYAATPNLVPFEFVGQFAAAAAKVGLSVMRPSTWLAFLSSSSVYMTLFNVLLTAPVGFYAHYLFGARWWQATLAGFLTSLFFELTQLSGLYGIYAHPYRLFDVNDLIVNTTGALVGFVLTLPVCRLLPDIDDVNARARERGRSYPSITRRVLALGFDLVLSWIVTLAVRVALAGDEDLAVQTAQLVASSVGITFTFVLVPLVAHGGTLGQRILRMRVVGVDGEEAPWWRLFARQTLLWWGLILLPQWALRLFPGGSADGISVNRFAGVIGAVWFAWGVALVLRVVVCRVRRQPLVMLNAWATATRLMSVPGIEAVRAETERKRAEQAEAERQRSEVAQQRAEVAQAAQQPDGEAQATTRLPGTGAQATTRLPATGAAAEADQRRPEDASSETTRLPGADA